jgi:hypothetical protein
MLRSVDLPEKNVTRELIYQLIQTMNPTEYLVDGTSLEIANSKIQATQAVPRWRKYTVDFEDLAAAATTNDIQLFELPAGGVIHRVVIKHGTAFAGGSISAYTVSVGKAGDLTAYAGAFDAFQTVGDTVFQHSGNEGTSPDGLENFGSVTSVRVAAVSTDDDLDAATAGEVDVFVLWSALPIT